MTTLQVLIVLCGLAAVLYGLVTSRQILSLGSGNDKMQEIAGAIQEGARAYLNRQYMTIAIVGVVIFALIWIVFDLASGIGFLIGAFFSGAAGYVGMNISLDLMFVQHMLQVIVYLKVYQYHLRQVQ